ncbi:hypothetical protein [Sphaerisporangium sp. NPDC051011]|uniref:hypothetical protein n=1 Tax=Sphaerisporangium sp. NPDC051011 TaxID=3155792 RepID=UPI0033D60E3F
MSTEAQLRDAHMVIAAILHMAGGRVVIPAEVLERVGQRRPLMQADTAPGGSVTYTLEPEA